MVSQKDRESIAVQLALGIAKDDLTVKINTPELEQIYQVLKKETDEAYAANLVFDFPSEAMEMPDFYLVEPEEE